VDDFHLHLIPDGVIYTGRLNKEDAGMEALVLNAPGHLVLRDEPEPVVGDRDVLVRVRTCTISRRDIEMYTGARPWNGHTPHLLGHEAAGIVERTGPAVQEVAPGDRVVVWNVSAGFAEYVVTPDECTVRLPDGLSFEEGAIAHTIPSAMQGMRQCAVQDGTVFVSGTGAAGMVCVQVARLWGASMVIVSDMHPLRLRRATDLGADRGINASTEDVVRRVVEETQGRGMDISVECAGDEGSLRNCEAALRTAGTLVVVGTLVQPVAVDLLDWQTRSLRLIMAREQPRETRDLFIQGLKLAALGAIVLRPLLTHVFPLHRAAEAFNLLMHDPNRAIKVALVP
jgi:2-desacetyl-2-hydroxyethyl bacteriochlorophyllide A dehydrogenase